MAEGYVIGEKHPETNELIGFWSGTVLAEDLQEAALYTDRTTARMVLGAIQSQYPEKEIALQPAAQVVQLVAAVNVPASNPQAVAVPAATTAQVIR
jgi:hypothetical protein